MDEEIRPAPAGVQQGAEMIAAAMNRPNLRRMFQVFFPDPGARRVIWWSALLGTPCCVVAWLQTFGVDVFGLGPPTIAIWSTFLVIGAVTHLVAAYLAKRRAFREHTAIQARFQGPPDAESIP